MEKTSFFGQFKVGTRIYTGFLVILLLLGVVALIGIRGFNTIDETSARYEALSANTERGVEIQRDVAEMRRNTRIYGLTGDPQALETTGKVMAGLGEVLGLTFSKSVDAGRKAMIGEMIKQFDAYREDFAKAVQSRKERDKVVNDGLTPIGKDMSNAMAELLKTSIGAKDLEALSKAALIDHDLLRIRYAVVRFINAPDPNEIPGIKADIDAFVKATDGFADRFNDPAHKKLAASVDDGADKYQKLFDQAAAEILTVNDLLNVRMPARAKEFALAAERLGAAQHKALEALTKEQDDTIASSTQIETAIAIGAALFGLFFAWLIARSITHPVVEMTSAMTTLAAGNHSITVPALTNKDEIGEMAKAVEVFKQNAIEKVRMDEAERQRLEAERKAAEAQRQRELEIGQEIAHLIDAVSKGNLESRIDLAGKDGFYKTMSDGINRLTDTVQGAIADIARVVGALAEGDLNQRITKDYQGAFDGLKNNINATSGKLAEIVGQIGDATEAISQAAAEVSSGSADLAERTEQQASSLEETAASMEELGATVRTSAENAQRANTQATDARRAGEQGGAVANSAIEAMKSIADSSRKITDIIGVIDEIAFQTNLLALNAAVEAARAGDAGKGFAVVAQEVRVLAQRSAQASKEIKTLILDSDKQVQNGVEMVKKAGDSLSGIVGGVQQVATLIAEMASAAAEQASALDEINSAVAAMDEMTQKNAALVEETTAAAQSMSGQATDLRSLVSFFKIDSLHAGHGGGHRQQQVVHHAPPAYHAPAPKPQHGAAARAGAKPAAKPALRAAVKPAVAKTAGGALKHAADSGDDEWKEF